MHHQQVLEVDQQLFSQLGRMPVLAQMIKDLALGADMTLALADMAANHLQLGFFRRHQQVLQPLLIFGERFRLPASYLPRGPRRGEAHRDTW